MQKLWFLLFVFLAGCVSNPFAIQPPATGSMAQLSVRVRPNYPFVSGVDGFVSVGNRDIPGGPVEQLWVAPGRHVIGYICPGWVTVDGPVTIAQTFVAGASYELTCESPSAIELVR